MDADAPACNLRTRAKRSHWRRVTGVQRVALILCGVAAAVLIHGLTVDHTTYDDRFVLYFRSRQLWWQRRYQSNKYFLGTSLCTCTDARYAVVGMRCAVVGTCLRMLALLAITAWARAVV